MTAVVFIALLISGVFAALSIAEIACSHLTERHNREGQPCLTRTKD